MNRTILLVAILLYATSALANGPWALYGCIPNMGPAGCVLISKPATRAICLEEMDALSKSVAKGTIVACTNGVNNVPALPQKNSP